MAFSPGQAIPKPGSRAMVAGLMSRQEFNGCLCTVLPYDERQQVDASSRIPVRLDREKGQGTTLPKKMKIKRTNLVRHRSDYAPDEWVARAQRFCVEWREALEKEKLSPPRPAEELIADLGEDKLSRVITAVDYNLHVLASDGFTALASRVSMTCGNTGVRCSQVALMNEQGCFIEFDYPNKDIGEETMSESDKAKLARCEKGSLRKVRVGASVKVSEPQYQMFWHQVPKETDGLAPVLGKVQRVALAVTSMALDKYKESGVIHNPTLMKFANEEIARQA